jgi:hypothetical protein
LVGLRITKSIEFVAIADSNLISLNFSISIDSRA